MARSKKKGSSKSNPYAGRGLDKYIQLISELTSRREKIAAQTGAPLDDVRFVSTGTPGEWKPVYPSTAVHSSASSSPKSGSRSPSPSTLPSAIAIAENEEKHSIIQQPPTEDNATFNRRELFSRLSFGFSLLVGLMGLLNGVLYATRSPLIAVLFMAMLVFLSSLYALQVKSKQISSWMQNIFGSVEQFPRLRIAGGYDQDRKFLQKEFEPVVLNNDPQQGRNSTFEQNTFSSSQFGTPPQNALPNSIYNSKPRASFPSRISASKKPIGRAHIVSNRQELPSPAFQGSNASIQKPKTLYSKLLPCKTRQREARSKMEMEDSTLGGSVSAAASEKAKAMEIKSRPSRLPRPTRNVARQDRSDDLLVMLAIALTALASGIVPGIIITTISWFWLPLLKGSIMAKDHGASNVGAINRKDSMSSKSKNVIKSSPLFKGRSKCKEDSTKSIL